MAVPRNVEEIVGVHHRCSCAAGSPANCRKIVKVSLPQVAEQFGARVVDVLVPRILKENFEAVSLALKGVVIIDDSSSERAGPRQGLAE